MCFVGLLPRAFRGAPPRSAPRGLAELAVGQHVRFARGGLSRAYTPVAVAVSGDAAVLSFFIKVYGAGAMTQQLAALRHACSRANGTQQAVAGLDARRLSVCSTDQNSRAGTLVHAREALCI